MRSSIIPLKIKLRHYLKSQGKLAQGESINKLFTFYRPEDIEILNAAAERHAKEMKKIYASNVIWHRSQAEKNPCLRDYHLEEAEKNMELSK